MTIPNTSPEFNQALFTLSCQISTWYDAYVAGGNISGPELNRGIVLHNNLKKLLVDNSIDYKQAG